MKAIFGFCTRVNSIVVCLSIPIYKQINKIGPLNRNNEQSNFPPVGGARSKKEAVALAPTFLKLDSTSGYEDYVC